MDRITIIGLGQIGASVGLAIKRNLRARGKDAPQLEIVGVDREPETTGLARKKGAIDRIEYSVPISVEGSSLVILATPVSAMYETMALIAPGLRDGAIVTDTGSTKAAVLQWAQDLLPDSVSFIGGHPMTGSEVPGVMGSSADLFDGHIYCVIPSPTADSGAVKVITDLVYHLGAEPFFIDAEEHDGLVAGISHMPIALSIALMNVVRQAPAWREMGRLAAGSFASMTRVSSSAPEMHEGIFLTNATQTVRWIDAYIAELQALRHQIAEGDEEALLRSLKEAARAHDRWLQGKFEPDEEMTLKEVRDSMGGVIEQLFLPDRAIRMIRDLTSRRNKKT